MLFWQNGESGRQENIDSIKLDSINDNPTNLELENVKAQNPDSINANLPNMERENVETQNPETENQKDGFPVLMLAITGGETLIRQNTELEPPHKCPPQKAWRIGSADSPKRPTTFVLFIQNECCLGFWLRQKPHLIPATKRMAIWQSQMAQETGTAGLRWRSPCFWYCGNCCFGKTEKEQSGETQNREMKLAKPVSWAIWLRQIATH